MTVSTLRLAAWRLLSFAPMLPVRSRLLPLLGVILLAARHAEAFCGQPDPDICPAAADPCQITANCTIPAGTVVNIGSRALLIQGGKAITVSGAGVLTLIAGSATLEPGAKILAPGAAGVGGAVLLSTSGNITIQTTGSTRGEINVSANNEGGSIMLDAGGSIDVNGRLFAEANGNAFSVGGSVDLTAVSGSITIAGTGIRAFGGSDGGGGLVSILAGQNITVSSPIDASNGFGGDISLETFDGDIVTNSGATMDASAGGLAGDGGGVTMAAGGSVTVGALIDVHAVGQNEDSGDGGEVDLDAAGGNVTLNAQIDSTGAAGGGGGFIDIAATGNIIQNAAINAPGAGIFSFGGEVTLLAGGAVTTGNITATGQAQGGTIFIEGGTGAVVSIPSSINVSGTTAEASPGIAEIVGCTVNLTGGITNTGPQVFPANAFTTTISARDVTIAGTLNTAGSNLVRYDDVGIFTPAATVTAGATKANRVEYLSVSPQFQAGASINPSPTVAQNLALDGVLPCCGECATTTTSTSTSTTTTTSTSTTTSSSTSTTSTSTTSTSTTSTSTTSTSTSSTSTSSSTTSTIATTTSTSTSTTSTTVLGSTTTSTAPTTTSTIATTTSTSSTIVTTTTSTSTSTTSTIATTTSTTSTIPTTTSTSSSTTSTIATTTSTTTSTIVTTTTLDTTTTTLDTTTTTVPTPTTTTTVVVTTTTTTTLPLTCLDEPLEGYEAIDCRIDMLTSTIQSEPVDTFGGARKAKKLSVRVAGAAKAIAKAESGVKEPQNLKRAVKKLQAFTTYVTRQIDRGTIPAGIGDTLIDLANQAASRLGQQQAVAG